MNRKNGCVVCEAGELFFYYKNDKETKVRIEAFDCYVCSGGVIKSGLPRPEEELISEKNFLHSSIVAGVWMDDVKKRTKIRGAFL